jgi:HAMP domain-containing protein
MNTQIAEQYLVHLLEPVAWDMQHEIAERLAVRLNVPLKRIEQTLGKGTGPMTRPLAQSEAQRIASAFSDMGLSVRVIADRSTQAQIAPPPATPRASFQAAPVENIDEPAFAGPLGDPSELVEAAQAKSKRGMGLSVKIIAATLIPVALIAIAALVVLRPGVQRGFDKLLDGSAAQVAYAVAVSLNTEDLQTSTNDLLAVAERRNIGFIKITPANSSGYYLFSKDPMGGVGWMFNANSKKVNQSSVDWHTNIAQASDNLDTSNGGQRFDYVDRRVEVLEKYSVDHPELASRFKDMLENLKKINVHQMTLSVQQADIFASADGKRFVRIAGESTTIPANLSKVSTVQIGLLDNEARTLGNQQSLILLALMVATLLVAIGVAVAVARNLSRPILSLTAAADRISLGMLDTPVVATSRDELGELAEALERMRQSLKLSIERLRRRR